MVKQALQDSGLCYWNSELPHLLDLEDSPDLTNNSQDGCLLSCLQNTPSRITHSQQGGESNILAEIERKVMIKASAQPMKFTH